MSLKNQYLGLINVMTCDNKIVYQPHILAVAVIGDFDKSQKLTYWQKIADECRQVFCDQFNTIEDLWGATFFDGWTLDPQPTQLAETLLSDSSGTKTIKDGTLKASIYFPAPIFSSSPNPPGRPDNNSHDIEGPIQKAYYSHVYLMQRFLCGFHTKTGQAKPAANNSAICDLYQFVEPVGHLTFIKGFDEKNKPNKEQGADKLVENAITRGPAQMGRLFADTTNKSAGRLMFKKGQEESGSIREFSNTKTFQQLISELMALTNCWNQARLANLGQRETRTEIDTRETMTVEESLLKIGVSKEALQKLTQENHGNLVFQNVADLARRHEIDATYCIASKRFMRPIAQTFIAVSAFEKRNERPDPATLNGVIAMHALSAMSSTNFAEFATMNGFGQNWPTEIIAKIVAEFPNPLPRHPEVVLGNKKIYT